MSEYRGPWGGVVGTQEMVGTQEVLAKLDYIARTLDRIAAGSGLVPSPSFVPETDAERAERLTRSMNEIATEIARERSRIYQRATLTVTELEMVSVLCDTEIRLRIAASTHSTSHSNPTPGRTLSTD